MARPIEMPRFEESDRGQKKITHPAFGMISVSRIVGDAVLHGASHVARGYVSLTISRGYVCRDLATDWYHAETRPLIEVNLSNAQWATLVSSLNHGALPCTLDIVDGRMVPELPRPKPRARFEEDLRTKLGELQDRLRAVAAEVDGANGVKARAALKREIQHVADSLTGSVGFIFERFGEHMEGWAEEAKADVSAHTQNVVAAAGLDALRSNVTVVATPLLDAAGDSPANGGS